MWLYLAYLSHTSLFTVHCFQVCFRVTFRSWYDLVSFFFAVAKELFMVHPYLLYMPISFMWYLALYASMRQSVTSRYQELWIYNRLLYLPSHHCLQYIYRGKCVEEQWSTSVLTTSWTRLVSTFNNGASPASKSISPLERIRRRYTFLLPLRLISSF